MKILKRPGDFPVKGLEVVKSYKTWTVFDRIRFVGKILPQPIKNSREKFFVCYFRRYRLSIITVHTFRKEQKNCVFPIESLKQLFKMSIRLWSKVGV